MWFIIKFKVILQRYGTISGDCSLGLCPQSWLPHTKITFQKWVLFLPSCEQDMKKFLVCWVPSRAVTSNCQIQNAVPNQHG